MIIKYIKKLFHKHKWNYIGKYYKVELADDLESYNFTLYKVWHCLCGKYEMRKLNVNNVCFMKVNETCCKYDCQGFGQLEKLGGDVIEVR